MSLERARINATTASCSSQKPSVVPWPMVRTAVVSSAAFIIRRHVAAASSALIAHRDAKRVLGGVRSGCARREASGSAPRSLLRGCVGMTSSPAPHVSVALGMYTEAVALVSVALVSVGRRMSPSHLAGEVLTITTFLAGEGRSGLILVSKCSDDTPTRTRAHAITCVRYSARRGAWPQCRPA